MPAGSSLLLYGSRARGNAREDSDWDLLILLDKPRLEADATAWPILSVNWDGMWARK